MPEQATYEDFVKLGETMVSFLKSLPDDPSPEQLDEAMKFILRVEKVFDQLTSL